jgi:hypothetical protein
MLVPPEFGGDLPLRNSRKSWPSNRGWTGWVPVVAASAISPVLRQHFGSAEAGRFRAGEYDYSTSITEELDYN